MNIQEEWFTKGKEYAQEVNEMVDFGEKNGWENWEGEDPDDIRNHLGEDVLKLLRKANLEGRVDEFRLEFPPSNMPIFEFIEKQSQGINQLFFIDDQKIVFLIGAPYEKRKAYLLDGDKISELDSEIRAIGKSKKGNVFAIALDNKISLFKDWNGKFIREFVLNDIANVGITELIPFNDGSKVLFVSVEGIYLISESEEKLIHPIDDEEDGGVRIDMENGALSNDNKYIVVGDQGRDHAILDNEGNKISEIGPQSSYPHFCLFSKDDEQLITNSCHFYNGITIGVDSAKLKEIKIEAYTDSDDYVVIDDEMRVYSGLATSDYYILGDAYGYIKAFDKNGQKIWRHYLGSTISSMTISDDEKTLWVGSCSGMLHKLHLGKGHRDEHTIGNGNHYEEFRLLIWKEEPQIWKW
ncbi:ligand-binding sensor domain-containing protein [Flavobacterium collinsii]|uniref:Outer membrane protein assembly factor BamB n=1 Tax=Flavobacterium collinsii TaxID=1114861 RepID=A0ABM8KE90_9FLAO|nr:hypothetical protein [Flavobacterium collinsii]CAA9195367.1 hypothetical protein FLACOL7796_00601 [Flavobacterium collinsii]